MDVFESVRQLFHCRGKDKYGSEAVTQIEHALQCAMLAEQSGADDSLVVAALLHDLGHLLTGDQLPETDAENLDDDHETLGAKWLARHFDGAVTDPIRLHVGAKRYLCTSEAGYKEKLSPASYKSFIDQGGDMNESERRGFEAEPGFEAGIRLRRWDDLAKNPAVKTKSIDDYGDAFRRVMRGSS